MKPYVLEQRCPAQNDLCKAIPSCGKGAIAYVEDEQAPLGGRIVFDYTRCDGCGDCVPACCGSADDVDDRDGARIVYMTQQGMD